MMQLPRGMWGSAFLAEPEERVEVGLQDPVELLGGDVGDAARLRHLVRRVVHEDVDVAEGVERLLDQLLAGLLRGEVDRHDDALLPGFLDERRRTTSVLLLARQVSHHEVRALSGVGQRHRATDARVAAGDDSHPVLQLPGAAVARLAVVGLVTHLGRDRVVGPGRGELFPLGVRLVVLLAGIGGLGSVFQAWAPVPGSARSTRRVAAVAPRGVGGDCPGTCRPCLTTIPDSWR